MAQELSPLTKGERSLFLSTERQANVSREARGACLLNCWGRGPATASLPLPRGGGAALFFLVKLERAFFLFSMIR